MTAQAGTDPETTKNDVPHNTDSVQALVRMVTKAMTTDNIEDMVHCFAADSDWVIMATGESFKEGTKLCWEYVHTGVVTERWPSTSARKLARSPRGCLHATSRRRTTSRSETSDSLSRRHRELDRGSRGS
jgi:hypothetical protein